MIDGTLIRLAPASDADLELWRLTKEVSERPRGIPWALIGGQMVAIIEAEYGGSVGRATGDVDALVDVRALSSAPRAAAERLTGAGFKPQYVEDNLAYRYHAGRRRRRHPGA